MGNDGSGWSMSVWPRSIDRRGQDGNRKSSVTVYVKRAKRPKRGTKIKRDDQKFEESLTKAIGAAAAQAYIRRKRRKKEK